MTDENQHKLNEMHEYLMDKKFPYHSVSVIYRNNDIGLHVIFMESVKELVTDEIKNEIIASGFTISYVN